MIARLVSALVFVIENDDDAITGNTITARRMPPMLEASDADLPR